ncbi:MAG TPA: MMPL family transporter, partial [Actinomycetota bacterium]|nr:MMPL family transporter [Actinomycetota bacterium]
MRLNSERVARASARRPWTTIGLWVVLVGVAGYLSSQLLGDVLTQEFDFTNRPESVRVQEIIDDRFGGNGTEDTEFVIVQSETLTVEDPAFRRAVGALQAQLATFDEEVLAGPPISYYDVAKQSEEHAAGLVSRDGHATLITVPLKDTELSTIEDLRSTVAEPRPDGFTVQVAGQGALFADFSELAEEDLRRGEMIGVAVALLILIVVFAALVAALVPIAMAIAAIAVSLGLVSVIGQLVDFNLFVTNMISMIGLAVGIDYSLFIVSRYREERRKGGDKLRAIGRSGATANRAVF